MQADTRSKGSVPLLASRARFGYLTRRLKARYVLEGHGGHAAPKRRIGPLPSHRQQAWRSGWAP